MKSNKKIIFLMENGLSINTISKMSDNQVNLMVEKFLKYKKEESKEQVTKTTEPAKEIVTIGTQGGDLPNNPTGKGYKVEKKADGTVKATPMETEMTEDVNVDKDNATAGQISQAPHQVQAPDGMDDLGDATIDKEEDLATEGVIKEKFESKAQQGLFWARCNKCSDKKCKWCKMAKEFSDSTSKKDYKKMPEKKRPEKTNESSQKYWENKILEMLEEEKKRKKQSYKKESESMILRKPKKMTMFSDEAPMKLPIAKMFSIGKK
jgi:hypothetical protein